MQPHETTTVMGPAFIPSSASSGSSQYSAPCLTPVTDKFIWRERVGFWVQYVRSCARGGDWRAKGVANNLGITLFMALDYSFQEVIKSAMQNGEIVLVDDGDEDEAKLDQTKIVQQIVHMVAKDSDTDGIRRLVKMNRDVYSCIRDQSESYETFAERFRGLAQTYLNHCHAGDTTQQSQVFAMLLFENAKLPTTVYNSVITVVIADAKSRQKDREEGIYVKSSAFAALNENLKTVMNSIDRATEESNTLKESLILKMGEILETVDNMRMPKRQKGLFVGNVPVICLSDAVAALRDFKHENRAKFDHQNERKRPYESTKGNVFDRLGTNNDQLQQIGSLMTQGHQNSHSDNWKRQQTTNFGRPSNGGSHTTHRGNSFRTIHPSTGQDRYSNRSPKFAAYTGPKEN